MRPFQIDKAALESLLLRQAEMLLSLKGELSATVFEALCAKAEHEHVFLRECIEADARASKVQAGRNRTLPAEYYTHRRLSPIL